MSKEKIIRSFKIIAIATTAALIIRFLFDIDKWSELWELMSITFFVSLPYVVGAISIFLSKTEDVRKIRYQILFPWAPIFGFLIITLIFLIEGWACWLMVLPLFLLFASLGGLTAGYFKLRKSNRTNNLHLSLAVLLPFFIGPIEKAVGEIPGFYKAYTYIDIESSKEIIWNHVTRVSEIKVSEDKGLLTNLLKMPRPIKAELNFEGVGAKREAIFDRGLIFNETVLKYEDEKTMSFSIKANTYEIPSTTFDEHILIGGKFFDVLEGTYELEKTGQDKYRLHLWSNFKMTTTFNFYASIWGKLIMKDIQENILQIIKERSERNW